MIQCSSTFIIIANSVYIDLDDYIMMCFFVFMCFDLVWEVVMWSSISVSMVMIVNLVILCSSYTLSLNIVFCVCVIILCVCMPVYACIHVSANMFLICINVHVVPIGNTNTLYSSNLCLITF